ncbi:hypothetical protein [Tranquillimonas alkanivorans]|uniref:hypothetical protein n=1 Tax=Tranquillimonas alkanivorans TaxID=441119 RepID=UPI0011609D28|nr:hypothetical protein [Tranquillimonas alkanivorans]
MKDAGAVAIASRRMFGRERLIKLADAQFIKMRLYGSRQMARRLCNHGYIVGHACPAAIRIAVTELAVMP